MTWQSRKDILTEISTKTASGVLAFVTGDRPGMETQVSGDQTALLPRHIRALGKQDRISLVLHTRGGDTNVPWPFVSYLREYCEHLTVIVPACANSAGTLLALGADAIVMGPFSELSPIDPTVANGFNPMDPAQPGQRLAIAVEDVLAYIDLTREHLDDGEARRRAFETLTQSVHPLALGNVKRSINQIRQLAKKLIESHPPQHEHDELQGLITRLTTEFYTHRHSIGRQEGRALGLPIEDADEELLVLMDRYHDELSVDLELGSPWNPAKLLKAAHQANPAPPAPGPAGPAIQVPPIPPLGQGAQIVTPVPGVSVDVRLERAFIETSTTCDAFVTEGSISQQSIPTPQGPQNAIAFELTSEEWIRVA